ncbi:MAG: outer membrane lipase/esterase [Motiliproteus sp.]|jgi:outer membrane lipase/esterase
MTHKKILSVLITALLVPQVQAADFSNTIFFGDSLTDSGSFLPILLQNDPSYTGAGKFTTNPGPVWSDLLADRYGVSLSPGNQGGTNYAEGGARISDLPGIGDAPADGATPIATQVQDYLTANGGVADPDALYSLWGGANDIFWIAGGNVPPADVTTYITTTASEQVAAISALRAAGARYVLVPVVPDIGATPFGVSQGATAAAGLTALSAGYNDALLKTLQAAGVEVIPVDTFALLNEVQAQPGIYGFTDVSTPACGSTASLLCVEGADGYTAGTEQSFLYADGVHPTSGGHQITSDYVQSILAAPAFAQGVGRAARYQQRALIDAIDGRIAQSIRQAQDSTDLWVSGEGGQGSAELEGSRAAVGVGVTQRAADHSVGFGFNFSKGTADLAGGSVDTQSRSMSLFGAWQRSEWQWQTSLVVTDADYETHRKVELGQATRAVEGRTEGMQLGMQLGVNYLITEGSLSQGPTARLGYQLQSLSGFTEDTATGSATAMKFGRQTDRQLMGSLGWQLQSNQGRWQPFAAVAWEQRLSGDPDPVSAALANAPDNRFTLQSISEDASYGRITLGVNGEISEQVSLNGRLVRIVANDDSEDTHLSLALNIGF